MLAHMKRSSFKAPVARTTVRVNGNLLDEAKHEASKRGVTLTSLIEQGLRLALKQKPKPKFDDNWKLPVGVCSGSGDLLVPIDFNDSAEMWNIIEDLERKEKLEREGELVDSSRR